MELDHSASRVSSPEGEEVVPSLPTRIMVILPADCLMSKSPQKVVRSLRFGNSSMTMAMVWLAPVTPALIRGAAL
jgi:hypothetical protein